MASSYRERSGRERRSEVETKRVFSLKTPLETLKMFNVLWGGSQFERTTGAVARSFRANSENEGLSFPPQPGAQSIEPGCPSSRWEPPEREASKMNEDEWCNYIRSSVHRPSRSRWPRSKLPAMPDLKLCDAYIGVVHKRFCLIDITCLMAFSSFFSLSSPSKPKQWLPFKEN